MRCTPPLRHRLTGVVVAVAGLACLGAATAVPASAAVPSAGSPHSGCVRHDNLVEHVHSRYSGDVTHPKVGDTSVFADTLDNADGHLVDLSVGNAVMAYTADNGHIMQHVTGIDYFKDGTVRIDGIVDILAVAQGVPQSLTATGLTGRYRGLVGTRDFTAQDVATPTSPVPSTYSAQVDLCPASDTA